MSIAAETPTVKRLIDEGVKLLFDSKPDVALVKFNQVLLISPNHAEAYFRIGQAYIISKQMKLAFDSIRKSISLDPTNTRYSLYIGGLYEKQRNLDAAEKEYQRILETGTRGKDIQEIEKRLALITGQKLASNNELNAALLIFNGLLLEYPDDGNVLYNIGNAYMGLNRVVEAETTFRKLHELNKINEIVNLNLSLIYNRTNRPQLAMEHLKKIIELGKKDQMNKNATIEYFIIDGRMKLAKKDWNGALQSFQKVINLDPKRTEAFFNISIANLQLGNTLMAERGFLSVLNVTPNDFSTRLNLGQMYFDIGQIEKAKTQLEYVVENDKSGRYAQQAKIRLNAIHTFIADKALQSGNVEESLIEYQKALEFFSSNVKASFNRGMIFIRQKKFAEARVEFEAVVRNDPKNLRGRINLGNIYEQLGLLTKAAEQYEIIMDIDKDDKTQEGRFARSKWKITKARGLWADKKLSEAEAVFEDITKENPNNFQAFAFLGILQSSKGKLREAAKSYQRVLNLRPANYAVKVLLGKVYEQLRLDSLAANEYRSVIFSGGAIPQVAEAEARLAAVESRLSGFSNTLSYQFNYDSNLNANDQDPISEVRSDLALSFIYALKAKDDLSFNINWSPTYSAFHFNQNDYFRSVIGSSVNYGPPEKNWNLIFSRQDQDRLVSEEKLSDLTSLSFGQSRKLFLSPILNLTPEGFEGEKIASLVSANLSFRYIQSFGNIKINSLTTSFSLSLNQTLRWGLQTNLSYVLSVYRNLKFFESIDERATDIRVNEDGSEDVVSVEKIVLYNSDDYENNSHTGRISVLKVLSPGLVASLGLIGTFTGYTNVDTGSEAVNKTEKRLNFSVVLMPSISYSFFKDLRFVVSGNLQKNFSSLGTGLSLDSETTIASFQSTSLGSYQRYSIEGGFVMNF